MFEWAVVDLFWLFNNLKWVIIRKHCKFTRFFHWCKFICFCVNHFLRPINTIFRNNTLCSFLARGCFSSPLLILSSWLMMAGASSITDFRILSLFSWMSVLPGLEQNWIRSFLIGSCSELVACTTRLISPFKIQRCCRYSLIPYMGSLHSTSSCHRLIVEFLFVLSIELLNRSFVFCDCTPSTHLLKP